MDKKVGGVKQIISPNCLLLTGPLGAQGLPITKFLTLQGIQTPEFSLNDKEQPKQESYGFKAREFLRKQLLGAQIEFTVEHKIKDQNDKVIGRVFKNGKDIGVQMLREGLAQVRQGSKFPESYQEEQEQAKYSDKGIWSSDQNYLKLNKIDARDIPQKQFNNCLIEDVAGLFIFYAYVPQLEALVKCSYGEIFVPQVSAELQAKAKWVLQDLILQQEVTLTFLGYDDKFQSQRCDIFKGKVDIKRELVSLGFYKLSPNAFSLVDQKRYNDLREAQSQAEMKLLGIWKDQIKQKQQDNPADKQTFIAKVLEVHSGDSLTVVNQQREQIRVFLASVKSPKFGKEVAPFGFEAREYARKLAIGQNVKVEIEYEKNIQTKDEEKKQELHMRFANILIQTEGKELNLAQQLISQGLATIQPPKGDDGYSKYLDEYRQSQEFADKNKKGQFGKQAQIPKLIDLSVDFKIQRSRDYFDSLKDIQKLTGVVELVLNGSRIKLRFNELNCSSLFLISGIKCAPHDANLPEYQKFSNIALQYTKEQILQRDVEIELESIDRKGLFHGNIYLAKRQNFALTLLELGLAVTFNPTQNVTKYQSLYKDAEQRAKIQNEGLWTIKNLDLAIIRGQDEEQTAVVKKLNSEIKKLQLIELESLNILYFQDPQSNLLNQIEKLINQFAPQEANKLVPPLKKGLLCLAKFSDGKWYRAKVVKESGKNSYEVFFVDFGNVDVAPLNNIRKIPDNLSQQPFQAIKCNLAYIQGPPIDHDIATDASNLIKDNVFDKEVICQLEYQEDSLGVIIHLAKDFNPLKTLNALLLQEGYAQLRDDIELPAKYLEWQKIEEKARKEVKGIWGYDQ